MNMIARKYKSRLIFKKLKKIISFFMNLLSFINIKNENNINNHILYLNIAIKIPLKMDTKKLRKISKLKIISRFAP